MATCPDCGEIVMEGDPYCSNCGATFSWSDDEDDRDDYYSGGGSFTPSPRSDAEILRDYARSYSRYLEWARKASEDAEMIKYYNYALDYGEKYWDLAKRKGISGGSIPDRNNLLPTEDVGKCSSRHYELLGKAGFFTDYETPRKGFEDLLIRSGNSHVVTSNNSRREEHLRIERERAALNHEIYSIQSSRENYFKYLNKANDAVERDAPKYAIKNYKSAIESHENYFSKDYEQYDGNNSKTMPQPPERLTDEARYYLLELYKRTHPLISSSKKSAEVNSEIVSILVDLHKDDLEKADIEVKEIIHQKELKRQRQKQQVEEVIVDGIVKTRILGGKIFGRFKK